MAKRCEKCGKGAQTGLNYTFLRSHWNSHNKRQWQPNLQSVRVQSGTQVKRMRVCTNCIKLGKIRKAG